jgi:hypothetical protein
MYGLWFKKPMDVRHPVTVAPQQVLSIRQWDPRHMADPPAFIFLPHLEPRSNNIKVLEFFSRDIQKSVTVEMPHHRRKPFLVMSLILICTIYGGIHLTTWHFDFPSDIEKLLWKISSIVVVSSGVLAPGLLLWSELICHYGVLKGTYLTLNPLARETSNLPIVVRVVGVLAIVTSPVIIAARLFVVAESFIRLRDVPAGVYATSQWTQYVPHI